MCRSSPSRREPPPRSEPLACLREPPDTRNAQLRVTTPAQIPQGPLFLRRSFDHRLFITKRQTSREGRTQSYGTRSSSPGRRISHERTARRLRDPSSAGRRGKDDAAIPTESGARTRVRTSDRVLGVGSRSCPWTGHSALVRYRFRQRVECAPLERLQRRHHDGRRPIRRLLDRHAGGCGDSPWRGPGTGVAGAVESAACPADRRDDGHHRRQRLLARGVGRRHLQLRRRHVLRLDRRHAPEQADRRHGGDDRRQGLLAGRVRRRDLQLRRRLLLRFDRVDRPQQAGRGHGSDDRRQGLLAGRVRRGDLQLWRRLLLRFDGFDPVEPAHHRHGPRA